MRNFAQWFLHFFLMFINIYAAVIHFYTYRKICLNPNIRISKKWKKRKKFKNSFSFRNIFCFHHHQHRHFFLYSSTVSFKLNEIIILFHAHTKSHRTKIKQMFKNGMRLARQKAKKQMKRNYSELNCVL